MNLKLITAAAAAALLAGCASDGSYYGADYGNGYGPGARYTVDHGYGRCRNCGEVVRIERIGGGRTSGTGALAGAAVGGILGNQVGSGDGRRAATVAGAVIGGLAGNEIERDNNARAYELVVELDNGDRVVLEQYSLDGIREGSRVQVSGGRAFRI